MNSVIIKGNMSSGIPTGGTIPTVQPQKMFKRLEISNLGSRGIVLYNVAKTKALFSSPLFSHIYLSPVMRKPVFAYAKTKTQISFAVTAKLISGFVFATRIV